MKKINIICLSILFFYVICIRNINAIEADVKTYTYETQEINNPTEVQINLGTYTYCTPARNYDFIDEEGYYNSVYTSANNVYWSKFDGEMKLISTVNWPLYYNINTEENPPSMSDSLTYNFGNALYYNGYLYVLYSRMANLDTGTIETENVMAMAKYDKQGNRIDVKEYLGVELNSNTYYEDDGTKVPFYGANCSLTINNGVIACFFGRNMYSGHQSSLLIFIDPESLEFVSNMMSETNSRENRVRYGYIYSHSISHSLGQRIIPTSDGQFLMMESGDAGASGSTRGLMLTKIYEDNSNNNSVLRKSTKKMAHYSEGGPGSLGYNNTYSVLGSLVELSDGYMYIGGLEPVLSRAYGNSINQEWNLFVQKISKDFYNMDSRKDMQLLDTPVRVTSGTPEYNGVGRLYLTGTEEDYGIKWLTSLDKKCVILVRAIKTEEENVVILWEQFDIEEFNYNGTYYGYQPVNSSKRDMYYMIIDKDANIVRYPVLVPNVNMNDAEQYAYKDGKIYWTTANGYYDKNIKVNVLDLNHLIGVEKGDLNKDGTVDPIDASIALDKYKYSDATEEDMKIGDMDENGIIDPIDASMILDVYKGIDNVS